MDHADRNIGGFVFVEQERVFAARDLGDAFDEDPMLGPVPVLLQAERRARLDADPLDLKPVPRVERVGPPPRTGNPAVRLPAPVPSFLQFRSDFLDRSHLVAVRHQDCIRRIDDHQVQRPDGHDRTVRRVDEGVLGPMDEPLAVQAVAGGVGRRHLGHGLPIADVAPRARKGDDHYVVMVLHYGVVDALRAAGGEGRDVRADEFEAVG